MDEGFRRGHEKILPPNWRYTKETNPLARNKLFTVSVKLSSVDLAAVAHATHSHDANHIFNFRK
jgi:hypothetical protein